MHKITLPTDQNHPQIKSYKEALEKGRESYHVLPRNGSWIVKKAGSERAKYVFQTQLEAKGAAEIIVRNQGSSLFIHGKDGRIVDRKDF